MTGFPAITDYRRPTALDSTLLPDHANPATVIQPAHRSCAQVARQISPATLAQLSGDPGVRDTRGLFPRAVLVQGQMLYGSVMGKMFKWRLVST